ncbi:regulatory protein RecX [Salinibacterium hongtaonis]|uniref:regulatory protein RecX n=1 Tax=Homoserinimonas hongtaonis TaxID=2079791 RepID=UPI000D399CD6|nr:regulatory protein RecX [Salinibacterium hongtaonis]AWB88911.1 RecX family transcriptional regulator [Salinibacterium hongtaonis]
MTTASHSGEEHLATVSYLPGAWAAPGVGSASTADTLVSEPSPTNSTDSNDSTESEESKGLSNKKTRRAENVSLAGLTRRNMSRWELEKLLRSRDLDDDAITNELDRLEGVGLIDDAALAETLVRTQHERKGLGRQSIISELRRRHIDQEIIDVAIEALDADDERERAFEIAEKRASQLSRYDKETAKRRLTSFMLRRGYSSAVVRDSVDHALGGSHPRGSSPGGPSGDGGGVRFR